MARIVIKHVSNVAKFLEKAYEIKPDDLNEQEKRCYTSLLRKQKELKIKYKICLRKIRENKEQ